MSPKKRSGVSASLVDANLTGHDSHGVIRVPRYVDWVAQGDLVPNQSIERIVDTPVIGVLDGRFGFGQTMAPLAVDIGVEKAKAAGLSAISLRNSGHVGRVGEWAERAAAAGSISIHFVNAAGSILVAPFGGLERRLSTAPFCVGVPREGAPPDRARFRDFAGRRRQGQCREPRRQAAAARRVDRPRRRALRRSRADLWPARRRTARATTPTAPAPSAPSASTRARASRCICELLGGSLTGNGATEPDRKFSNGMFSLYLDPDQIDPAHVFDADMTRYLDWFQQAKAIPGEAILTPGEPERAAARETRAKRRAAAGRGLGVDRRGGAERRREPGPLVLTLRLPF